MSTPAMPMSAWFAAMHKAMTSEDPEALKALIHPDFVLHEDPGVPYGGVFKGQEGFLKVALAVRDTWCDQTLERMHYSESPETNTASIVLRMRARAKPTGTLIETYVSEIWSFRDGLGIEAYVWYWNTPELIAALKG